MATITTTKISQWGNSQALRLSSAILDEAGLDKGSLVNVEVVAEGLLIKPAQRLRLRRMKLTDMLADCDISAPMPDDITPFADSPAVGKELL